MRAKLRRKGVMTNNYGKSFHLACFSAGKLFTRIRSRCPRFTTEWTKIYAFRNTLVFYEFSSNILQKDSVANTEARFIKSASSYF